MDVYDKIKNLSVEDYKVAFEEIKQLVSEHDLKMLKAHYEAPNHTVTAQRLAKYMNFANYNAANLRYGSLARHLCDYCDFKPTENLAILVYFEKINNQWHWTLRENVVKALRELNWFDNRKISNAVSEIDDFKIEQKILENTSKESLIQSRLGQGLFRSNLIRYWEGCSVTGCQFFDILKASHIKPWRYSTNEERLNHFNGLLLIPTLDALFDIGMISFDNRGKIMLSPLIEKKYRSLLNISDTMLLRKLDERHIGFLEFHQENVFRIS